MRIVEKSQLMSASEIDRTIQRLAHEIVEKSGGTKHLALIGIRRRGVPLAQRIAKAMRGLMLFGSAAKAFSYQVRAFSGWRRLLY